MLIISVKVNEDRGRAIIYGISYNMLDIAGQYTHKSNRHISELMFTLPKIKPRYD